MKKLVLIFFLFPSVLSGQEIIDTIPHTTGECGSYENEEFNFTLCNDTLNFFGIILANCGGEHFLIYSRISDTILLTKLDTGDLEDCMCAYNFDISIPDCNKHTHRLLLLNYSGNDTIIDTLITTSITSIQSQKENDLIIYPNPSKGLINIIFYRKEKNLVVKVYTSNGQCFYYKSYHNTDNLYIDDVFLPRGVCLIKIETDNHTYTKKIVVN